MFWIKIRYSVLFGLTDNLLATIQENISLIHDSIYEKPLLVLVKKIYIFGCYQHNNVDKFQDI